VSNHPRGPLELSSSALRVFATAMGSLEIVLEMDVVGIIVYDDHGIALIPRPGCDRELIDLLDRASWKEARRIVEEHRP